MTRSRLGFRQVAKPLSPTSGHSVQTCRRLAQSNGTDVFNIIIKSWKSVYRRSPSAVRAIVLPGDCVIYTTKHFAVWQERYDQVRPCGDSDGYDHRTNAPVPSLHTRLVSHMWSISTWNFTGTTADAVPPTARRRRAPSDVSMNSPPPSPLPRRVEAWHRASTVVGLPSISLTPRYKLGFLPPLYFERLEERNACCSSVGPRRRFNASVQIEYSLIRPEKRFAIWLTTLFGKLLSEDSASSNPKLSPIWLTSSSRH